VTPIHPILDRARNGPPSSGGGLARLFHLRIGAKLELSFLLIILVISLILSLVGTWVIGGRFEKQAQEKVHSDLNSAREIYQNNLLRISDAVRFVSDRDFVRSPATAGGRDRLLRRLTRICEQEHLDALALTDARGVVILRTSNPGVHGDDQSRQQLVRAVLDRHEPVAATVLIPHDELVLTSPALAERATIALVPTEKARPRAERYSTAGMALKAAAPVFDFDHRFIGVVYGGVLLNRNHEIVDKIKQTVFPGMKYRGRDMGSATIFQDDLRISTNVMNPDGSRAIGTRAAGNVYDQVVRDGKQWIGDAYVVRDLAIAAYEPIRDLHGATIGMLYVGLLKGEYNDVRRRTVLVFLAVTLIGSLLALTLSHFLSQRLSGSVKLLVAGAEQLACGNLDQRVEVRSGDEFQELAETFNAMAEALKARDEQLKQQATRKVMESERLAMVGQLAAGVAHEINNPLTGIVTYSQLLLEKTPGEGSTRASLQKIVTQANRCRKIVRGLLEFSRQSKPDERPCNVNTVLQECVALVANQALFQNIEIVRHLAEDLPLVPMDPSQIQQVFLNLIINAAEATPGEGRLTLATRMAATGQDVEVEFADTGCGIKQADLERIFEPFFTTKGARRGTGLGLAISYGIVKEHRGVIAVTSEVGKGTTFTVRLPLSLEGEAA
jgi:two-component system, NtrC family, sensor kinase